MTTEIDNFALTDIEKDALVNASDAYPDEGEGTTLRISTQTDMGVFNRLAAKKLLGMNGGRPDIFLSAMGVGLRRLLREERGLYVPEEEED